MTQMEALVEQIETLQNELVSIATGGSVTDERELESRRRLVVDHPALHSSVPRFLRTCRSSSQFWHFIKQQYPSYAERRQFIWDAFRPLLEAAERPTAPSDDAIAEVLLSFDQVSIHAQWTKALERRDSDPEGAITASGTLLEAVCKHILDEQMPAVEYGGNTDLPALYKLVAKQLNIAPSQHTEEIFRQILGGCTAIVEGLGALRNRLGDAHGQGKRPVRPAPRHAELAVNLAGALATFLIATHSTKKQAHTHAAL